MARARLQRGEASGITYRGMIDGKWTMASKIPGDRKPSKWRATVRYQDGSSPRPKEITAEDSSKARAETRVKARLADARKSGRSSTDASTTVRQAVTQYLTDLEEGTIDKAPATLRTYRSVINHDVLRKGSAVADMRLTDVTVADLKRELIKIQQGGGQSHLSHVRAIWGHVFSDAVDAEVIDADPTRSLKLPERRKKDQRTYGNGATHNTERHLAADERAELWSKVSQDEHARKLGLDDLVLLGLTQGLRIAEAVSIRWDDLDLDAEVPMMSVKGKLVRINGKGLAWDEVTKSTRGRRTIPFLSTETVLMLRRRRSERDQMERHHEPAVQHARDTHVFLSETGRYMDQDNVNKHLRKLFDRAGYPWVTFHTLRRTVRSTLARAHVSDQDIALFMGHSERVSKSSYSDGYGVPVGALQASPQMSLTTG
ncbi:hypothetical protein CFK38_06220 [Brachybacterium vulturis]|uniref:Tyr recombinase domain-containing protein n=1 Tax=Brachybacterium vulturis TaxID=2017484 RepID=A0A291GMG4_9MICO|nr:site-specific integrase [Brachybacterium vulturis]ATG51164.1 hypothetical protein CFK38_06220 [Brachybacterium vulturis]